MNSPVASVTFGTASALPLPACGERVGVRGHFHALRLSGTPPHPARFARHPLPADGEREKLADAAV
jgi:hypothetical protein